MSTFGPFYPRLLQRAVTHAERVMGVLSDALDAELVSSRFDPDRPSRAELWLLGRSEEVEAMVADVIREWRRGVVATDEAALSINQYVRFLHDGLRRHTHRTPPLSCCPDSVVHAATSFSAFDAETRAPVL